MSPQEHRLKSSDRPLTSAYDCAMLDLDGVVYVGAAAVPGAPEFLGQIREAGVPLAFVTNNAARTPTEVAAHDEDARSGRYAGRDHGCGRLRRRHDV